MAREYALRLDLPYDFNCDETRALNSAISRIRSDLNAEIRTVDRGVDPRIRINDVGDAPEGCVVNICVSYSLPNRGGAATAPIESSNVQRCGVTEPASVAIEKFARKFASVGLDQPAGELVLVIKGTEEVIAGEQPLWCFEGVRKFIGTGEPILMCTRGSRVRIASSIAAMEIDGIIDEPPPEDLFAPVRLIGSPPRSFDLMPGLPNTLVRDQLTVYIGSCMNIPGPAGAQYAVGVGLYHGLKLLTYARSRMVVGSTAAHWNEYITLPHKVSLLPRAARVSLTLYRGAAMRKGVATINAAIFAFNGWLNSGQFTRRMWAADGPDPSLTSCESAWDNAVAITFGFPQYRFPIAFHEIELADSFTTNCYTESCVSELRAKQRGSPFWRLRTELLTNPRKLLPLLRSVDYTAQAEVRELPGILAAVPKPQPCELLSLLGAQYPEPYVRRWAVQNLATWPDNDLMLYMLQLVEALKFEHYDDSLLAEFLIEKGLKDPHRVGHRLFWQLMSEAHNSHIRRRFAAILVNFLHGLGVYREEFLAVYDLTQKLVDIHAKVKPLPLEKATNRLREYLRAMSLPVKFHLPMDSRFLVNGFNLALCSVIGSNAKPLMLAFDNAGGDEHEPILAIFKVGDDLRQDQLTIQLMQVMENLWSQHGLHLPLRCYAVLPTGPKQGFIEVVQHAVTESKLQKEGGHRNQQVISEYLRRQTPVPEMFADACHTFTSSSAGYAVATYVLGVGDRHPGNIMIQQDGHFFHIDFGYFLGHFIKAMGINRDAAPFHFSNACQFVIDHAPRRNQKDFDGLGAEAWIVLRQNWKLLKALLFLMLGSDLPQLKTRDDVYFVKRMLKMNHPDGDIRKIFTALRKKSLDSTITFVNNVIHNLVN
jgi:phosphatidylinositol-4,5-bisphosphate 3-kinase